MDSRTVTVQLQTTIPQAASVYGTFVFLDDRTEQRFTAAIGFNKLVEQKYTSHSPRLAFK